MCVVRGAGVGLEAAGRRGKASPKTRRIGNGSDRGRIHYTSQKRLKGSVETASYDKPIFTAGLRFRHGGKRLLLNLQDGQFGREPIRHERRKCREITW